MFENTFISGLLTGAFFLVLGLPVTRLFNKWLDKRVVRRRRRSSLPTLLEA